MAPQQTTKKLVKHIDEGVAMEHSVLRSLDSMIRTTQDPGIVRALEQHKRTTRTHAERLEQRLNAYGSSPSRTRKVGGILGARLKGVADLVRLDKPGRNARDGFVMEQLEIASYELLERVARRAGDDETAEVARQNRAEDEAMAQRLAREWDTFAALSLEGGGANGGGSRGKGAAVRGGVARVASLGQNPIVLGVGSVAAGFLAGRRGQGGAGGGQQAPQQQKQESSQQQLELLTKKELQERAQGSGVEVRRSMTKQELIDAIRNESAGETPKASAFEVQNFLEGVRYPTSRDELVSEAQRKGGDARVRSTLNRLPKRTFNTPAEVSEAIGQLP